jgi:hypothetical protein
LLVPFFIRKYGALRRYLGYHGLPMVEPTSTRVYLLSLAVWISVGIRFGTLGFHPFSLWGYYGQLDDEIFELLAAYSFLSFALLDLRFKLKGRLYRRPTTGCRFSPGKQTAANT